MGVVCCVRGVWCVAVRGEENLTRSACYTDFKFPALLHVLSSIGVGSGGWDKGDDSPPMQGTTGRAIRGNIQFEAGSIGPSAARDNTEAENPTQRSAVIDLLYDLHTVLLVVHAQGSSL